MFVYLNALSCLQSVAHAAFLFEFLFADQKIIERCRTSLMSKSLDRAVILTGRDEASRQWLERPVISSAMSLA